ncbi:MAG: flagellar export chaperone FliS [Oligoflexia bacterium]|nr:flagellar export chaperone FliS [Oligoflexia bacterium]
MSQNKALQKYKQTSVTSASREKLLLMMYEGAIKFTKKAVIACEAKNIGDRGLYIGKAYDIIMELNNTLNFEVGGEIAKNLEQLYMFMTDQLTQANITGDANKLHVVLKLLNTLNEGWIKAIDSLKKQKTDSLGSDR